VAALGPGSPRRPLEPDHRQPGAGRWQPVRSGHPYHGAVTVDRLLPRSRLLTLAGWGHTSLFLSACIDAHVNTYLLTTQVPPKGTVCQPDVVLFAEPAATAQTLQAGAASKTALVPPMLRGMLTDRTTARPVLHRVG
jgi:hypothetical protein